MSGERGEARVKQQIRDLIRRSAWPASEPGDVICCGHSLVTEHGDDGCNVGWPAEGCPCRVTGWAP